MVQVRRRVKFFVHCNILVTAVDSPVRFGAFKSALISA